MAWSPPSLALPVDVVPVVASLLELLDAAMPSCLEGLYLLGSLALDDYQPGQSDVDFVAVIASGADPACLVDVHKELAERFPEVSCDGIYLTCAELAAAPGGVGPAARDGMVTLDSPDERHVVTWLTLMRHAVVVRGRTPAADWIAGDANAARSYSRDNLRTYWLAWRERLQAGAGDPSNVFLSDSSVIWGCLGILRLHAAIVTGEMVSKSAAGAHGLQHFRAHRAIIAEALGLRLGGVSGYDWPVRRAEDLIGLMDAVIDAVP